jgi:hypothetical protein
MEMKARFIPLIAVLVLVVSVALAVPTGALATGTYIQLGTGYWLHANGSLTLCTSCQIEFVNETTGGTTYTTTNPYNCAGVQPQCRGKWAHQFNLETYYEMYLTYETSGPFAMFAPAYAIPGAVTGQCIYSESVPQQQFDWLNPPPMNDEALYLQGKPNSNNLGCPNFPEG